MKINNHLLALTLDPALFMYRVFGIKPDEWQKELLRKLPYRSLLLCSRQSGKSTVSSVIALYHAICFPGSLILIISKASRQAEELFRKMKTGFGFLEKHGLMHIVHDTQKTVEFSNGSRVISLPGKQETIRAYSAVAFIIIDEAAQVPDELYKTVRPMLAVSGGKIICMTTPYGKRGFFFNAWMSEEEWYRVSITADECPRITEQFIKEEKQASGEWWVKQEYFCEFVDTDEQLFDWDQFHACITDSFKEWRM
jgi:hypothetical protein